MKDLKNEELERVSGGTVWRLFDANQREIFYSTAAKKFYKNFGEASCADKAANGNGQLEEDDAALLGGNYKFSFEGSYYT